MIENGYDVVYVQSLLGHNSVETTMMYVHMASPKMIGVESPLDGLDIKEADSQLNKEYRNMDYEGKGMKDTGCVSGEFG